MRILAVEGSILRQDSPVSSVFIQQRVQSLRRLGAEVVHGEILLQESLPLRCALYASARIPLPRPVTPKAPPELEWRLVTDTLRRQLLSRMGKSDPAFNQRVEQAAGELIQRARPEAVHLHWAYPIGAGVLAAAKQAGLPLFVTCHGSEINLAMASPEGRNSLLAVLHGAAGVEFVSGALLNTAMARGYDGVNGAVLPNGFDPKLFHLPGRIPQPVPTVGFVGNLIHIKGADRLAAIFHRLSSALGGNVRFLIVGDGLLKNAMEKALADLPVTFTGRLSQDETARRMRQMDVLLLPSRSEGYPCVVREAMACGALPVVTDVGGSAEAAGSLGAVVSVQGGETDICARVAGSAAQALKAGVDHQALADFALGSTWDAYQAVSLSSYRAAVGS